MPQISLGDQALQYSDQACASGPYAADLQCPGQGAQCPGHAASGLPSTCPSESSWLWLCGTMGSVTRLFCTHFVLRIFLNSSRKLKYCLTLTGIITELQYRQDPAGSMFGGCFLHCRQGLEASFWWFMLASDLGEHQELTTGGDSGYTWLLVLHLVFACFQMVELFRLK